MVCILSARWIIGITVALRRREIVRLRRPVRFLEEELMSFVTTQPEALASAAAELDSIGAAMEAGDASVATPTTAILPAAADQVSALTAAQFSAQGQLYQAVSAQALAIHEMFVTALSTSAATYAATEVANAAAVD
jgi:PE family protein